jgi:FAD synthetase
MTSSQAYHGLPTKPSGQQSADAIAKRQRPQSGVGDEILAAKVADSNTGFLCKELHAIGWRVSKVSCLAVHLLDPRVGP